AGFAPQMSRSKWQIDEFRINADFARSGVKEVGTERDFAERCLASKSLNDISIGSSGTDTAGPVVVFLGHRWMRVMQEWTSKMRFVAGMYCCRGYSRCTE